MSQVFRSFWLQPPLVALSLVSLRFRLRLNHGSRLASRPALLRAPCGILTSPLSSWLVAATGRIEFTFVPDRSFASRCSPPRLATTQLRSATVSNSNLLVRTCTSLACYTRKRTRSSLPGRIFERSSNQSYCYHQSTLTIALQEEQKKK